MGATLCPILAADYLMAHSASLLTPLQVIKMVYIAHGYTLALLDEPLVGEPVEAWRYGPVVPSVYHSAKKYGGSEIDELLYSGIRINDAEGMKTIKRFFDDRIPPQQRAILDGVLEGYGRFTGIELTRMTHGDGTPWSQYYRPDVMGQQIPNAVIKSHYKELIDHRAA